MKILCFILCLCMGMTAYAACKIDHPRVTVQAEYGRVKYINTQSRAQFAPNEPNAMGLTVTQIKVKPSGSAMVKQDGKKYCVGIKSVVFYIGDDVFDVYIDRKYRPGTCAYKVIKEHEDYHVSVYRQGLNFYKPDLEKALMKAIQKVEPQYVSSPEQAQAVVNRMFERVIADVQPTVDFINKKLKEKNAAIDTQDSYRRTMLRCDKW